MPDLFFWEGVGVNVLRMGGKQEEKTGVRVSVHVLEIRCHPTCVQQVTNVPHVFLTTAVCMYFFPSLCFLNLC